MGEHKLADTRFSRGLGRHRAGGVLTLEGHVGLRMGKGGFVNEQVCTLRQGDGCFAEHGVRAVHKTCSGFFGPAQGSAVDLTSILQRDGFPPLEGGINRSGGDRQLLSFLDVKATGLRFFLNAIGIGRNAMVQRCGPHGEICVLKNDPIRFSGTADLVHLEGIANPG